MDFIFSKSCVTIMVNCCFWHGHKGCRYATKPKTNVEFWETKIARNRHRDEVTNAHLEALGWNVISVWECELSAGSQLEDRLDALTEEIRFAGKCKIQIEIQRKVGQTSAKRERVLKLERQVTLEKEICGKFHIPTKVKVSAKEE